MKLQIAIRRAWPIKILLFLLILQSCQSRKRLEIDPAFAQYISAFTSGSISVASPVRIRLAEEFVAGITPGEEVKDNLISFSPSINGRLIWIDKQTLEFQPEQWLAPGEIYRADFKLGKLTEVPKAFRTFSFEFSTIRQFMEVQVTGVQAATATDLRRMELTGQIRTFDVCRTEYFNEVLTAKQDGKKLPVVWTHSEDLKLHTFQVDSIRRTEKAGEVQLNWNGKKLNSESSGEIKQEIPALGDFRVFFTRVVQQPEQYVVLQFSDPLDPQQNLDGLIQLNWMRNVRLTIDRNEVRMYAPSRLTGSRTITVHPGIRNVMGYASKDMQQLVLRFEDLKPEVQLSEDRRTILPSTDGLIFPFRAVSLSAVDVRVIQIFADNVSQFLQVNDLSGERELKRVGRLIIQKSVPLNPDGTKDLSQWNTFYLNLDEFISAEPGAVYRIEIGFRKSYSLYACEAGSDEDEADAFENSWDTEEQESSNWDYVEEYYGDYYDDYYDWDYDWSERDNPCNNAYYKTRRAQGRNILASDLGLIYKQGTDQSSVCIVTDLKTAAPLTDVDVELLNYQQRVIASGRTGNDGRLVLNNIDGAPFLMVAKKGKQAGYLKLDGGHSLSLSTFDVGGTATQKGLKGFIYGDRGVWRPGDTLFLAFMLEDGRNTLPSGHPIQFELKDPQGRVVQKLTRTLNPSGVFPLTCSTRPDAPTGVYQASVKVGGASFSKPVRIETVKPNRLKLALDFGKERITSGDNSMSGNLTARWLHGAVARNLKASVSATFSMTTTRFDRFTDYHFDDPIKSFSAEEQVIFEGNLNAEGLAKVPVDITLSRSSPGMVNANFSVKVFEEGGDFSVDRFTIPYAPYDRFVGVKLPKGDAARGMLLTDTDQLGEVVCLDANGKPQAVKELNWKLYKVQWRWWWEQSTDELSNYVGMNSTTPIAQGTLSTDANGKGNFKFRVNYPDWGRYLIRVEDPTGGHSTGKTLYIDWPGWAGRAQSENPGGASMLMFSLDKKSYEVGESCTITIPSSEQGRILVSIENGSRVISSNWVTPRKGETTFTFRTTPEMAPNAYLHVTLLQPHAQTANDVPIRLYGIQPLLVGNKDSHLEPTIQMADELEPEKPFEVRVCEKSGKGMTYTLAIVDEGLLDLTRFKTPDPWNHFYAREALGVNTYDLFDEVIGAQSSKPDRLLSIGGSDELGKKSGNQVNRFKPVVIYEGPFTLKPGECKTHKLMMPNYVGSVRVMVVGRKEKAYGHTEKAVPVKKPLMVLATLPRVLGPQESVQLPVNVFAMDKSIREVSVTVELNDLLKSDGPVTRTMKFSGPGDEVINFPLTTGNREGRATAKITAISGSLKSIHEIELEVRSPNPYQSQFTEAVVEAGKEWNHKFSLNGIAGTNTVLLEVSSIPSVDFGRRLKYLLNYPHGCLEQTTSAAFPQLYLSDVMELGKEERQRAEDNVRAAIARLTSFIAPGGGFLYWPGSGDADPWSTSYAGHFLIEAKKKGFTLPAGMESSLLNYQKRAAQNWRMEDQSGGNPYYRNSDLEQAYRLYTLALAGQPELSAMNRLRERPALGVTAKWRLAAAYAIAGQKETARQLIRSQPVKVEEYTELGYTFGSAMRDEAMIIETLVLLDDRGTAAPMVKTLSAQLSSDTWYNTQATAFGLLAISRFAANELGREIKYGLTFNDKKLPELLSNKPLVQQSLDARMTGNTVSFRNNSKNLLYVRLVQTGKPAAGNEQAVAEGLNMQVKYSTIDGRPVDVSKMDQGTDFYAEITISHNGLRKRYDELALTQIFPSGWEIINSRMDQYVASGEHDKPEYQDIRDDRVLTYFDLLPGHNKTYRVKLNATYLGRYYLPGFHCEAMYDQTIRARNKGQWVEVVAAGGATVMK